MRRPTSSRSRPSRFPAVLVLALSAACTSGSGGRERANAGSLEDLSEMVAHGAVPVQARSDETELVPADADVEGPALQDEASEIDPELESVVAEVMASGGRLDAGRQERVRPEPASNPYMAFGERILVHADGRVTKPFALPPKKGRRLLDLMLMMSREGFFPLEEVKFDNPGVPDPNVVKAVLLEDWDSELYQDLRAFPPKDTDVSMSDWLVCTASQGLMGEVEYFVNLFAAGIPQIEIEAKIVELTETDIFDFGITPALDASGGAIPQVQFPSNTLIDDVLFNFPNAEGANEAILALGAVQDGVTVTAILEAVKTWDNVSIISQPKIAVREGGKAEILNTEELPFFNVKSISDTGTFNATLDFKEVGVKLYIVPRVVGTNTFALQIDIEASQEAGSLTTVVSDQAGDLETPIIAKRSVHTVVYLEEGQVLILGGLTSTRKREFERKIPLLGDIPVLGYLFKSKFNQVTRSHVLFFIRPRILEGSDFHRDF